jgi:hypothetical protein
MIDKIEQAGVGEKPKRVRRKTYQDRVTVSFRLEAALHERMMAYCEKAQIPANRYFTELVETDLKKREKR